MGLKGYRLWVMCQRDSDVQSPTGGVVPNRDVKIRGVAVQVAFVESKV
jgi:hypothetical protein